MDDTPSEAATSMATSNSSSETYESRAASTTAVIAGRRLST